MGQGLERLVQTQPKLQLEPKPNLKSKHETAYSGAFREPLALVKTGDSAPPGDDEGDDERREGSAELVHGGTYLGR